MATLPLTTDTLEDVPSVETIDPDARRRELASFLRSRRERVQPQDVGLPPGIRRRTPGLRREEVAQLSGVGVTWYTWLEQGRDINVSTQVVDAIARTLKLDRYEWAHLSTLAGIATGPQPQQCAALPAAVRRVMHQVAPYPAAVLNDRFDLLAYNPEYRELIVDLDALPAIEHNLLWLAFTNPDWRAAMIDAEQSRCRLVGTFRSNMAKHLGEPGWQDLLTRLCAASPEFAERWERHEVAPMGQRLKVIDSPTLGLLRLESTSLWVNQRGTVRLLVYTPLDDESAAKLPGLSPA